MDLPTATAPSRARASTIAPTTAVVAVTVAPKPSGGAGGGAGSSVVENRDLPALGNHCAVVIGRTRAGDRYALKDESW